MIKKVLRKVISLFCICKRCPSYPNKNDLTTYCKFGKSNFQIEKRGCVCPECFVWKVNRFKKYYYCENGKDPQSKI